MKNLAYRVLLQVTEQKVFDIPTDSLVKKIRGSSHVQISVNKLIARPSLRQIQVIMHRQRRRSVGKLSHAKIVEPQQARRKAQSIDPAWNQPVTGGPGPLAPAGIL
jgi:hypothetical protein